MLSHYLFIFEKFEKDRGRNVPVPRESRASGTRRCGRVFGTAIARVLKIPVTTPIDPPPTAPVLIQTPLSLSLCVCVSAAKLCKHISEHAYLPPLPRFSKKTFGKSFLFSCRIWFFLSLPRIDGRQRIYQAIVCDYWMLGLSGRTFFEEKSFGPQEWRGWLVVRQTCMRVSVNWTPSVESNCHWDIVVVERVDRMNLMLSSRSSCTVSLTRCFAFIILLVFYVLYIDFFLFRFLSIWISSVGES